MLFCRFTASPRVLIEIYDPGDNVAKMRQETPAVFALVVGSTSKVYSIGWTIVAWAKMQSVPRFVSVGFWAKLSVAAWYNRYPWKMNSGFWALTLMVKLEFPLFVMEMRVGGAWTEAVVE
ncbi:hypothetical protein LPTSP2_03940 [Leptospira ellinghausenii]|uniref:Uncharacterized protein n=1 Tax=Leptospira ellinghausenii TaxID=1917822 RepID=A0A2P2D915_9LEPT|nr:hypothetical protein LPTSP2_03940 [Leptospira ellinghausenii]